MSDQARVRRIRAFQQELGELTAAGVVTGDEPVLQAVERHHAGVLAELARREEIDLTRDEARLSAGMRIATLLGAAALSIAWAMFVSSLWKDLGPTMRLLLVWMPPLALVPLIGVASRRDPSGYVASIVAVVASIAVAVACPATLSVYQLGDARWPFLVVGVFATGVAMRWRLALPLLIGIGGLGGWLWSLEGWVRGATVDHSWDHGEPVVLLGLAAIAIGGSRWAGPDTFRPIWRLLGVVAVAAALLVMGVAHEASGLGLGRASEGLYQVLGLLVFVAITWQGLRTDDAVLTRGGATALVLYLVFRMFDWFWRTIPDWLFFLAIGMLAFGFLLAMRTIRLRRRTITGR